MLGVLMSTYLMLGLLHVIYLHIKTKTPFIWTDLEEWAVCIIAVILWPGVLICNTINNKSKDE
jgi:hypothetical protein